MPKATLIKGAVWDTAYQNDLPDSCFLWIQPGGTKDSSGKTTPRSLRHFPVKDANGTPDMAHVRNAIARIPQSNAPGLTDAMKAGLQEKARAMLGMMKSAELPKAHRAAEDMTGIQAKMDKMMGMMTQMMGMIQKTGD